MHAKTLACLALTLVPGLGPSRLSSLLRRFPDPGRIFQLSRPQLQRLQLSPDAQLLIAGGMALKEAEEVLRRAQSIGVQIVSIFEDCYPDRLKEIFEPPLVLYCRGDLSLLADAAVAVVGSRRCSVYGRQVTRKLSSELAQVGLCIVSGLARGIDSTAHAGALAAGGKTVAVLGNGIDVVYPRENRKLYRQVAREGCLISEFPLGAYPAPQNFPIRNRIISGLCLGTLITEASEFSGSLITSRLTIEQNRELWAVPGNITSAGSYGPNYLIKQGAHPVLCAQDILDSLPCDVLVGLRSLQEPPHAKKGEISKAEIPISASEKEILKLLDPDASIHFDRLLEQSRLSVAELNRLLLDLEIKGLTIQLPGRRFSRKLF